MQKKRKKFRIRTTERYIGKELEGGSATNPTRRKGQAKKSARRSSHKKEPSRLTFKEHSEKPSQRCRREYKTTTTGGGVQEIGR